VGFEQDVEADWVAELSCGHTQHVRHEPPFSVREWATSEAGRAGRLESLLLCSACDRSELPSGFLPYQRTKVFTEETVPVGLLASHATKRGVWGLIHVHSGALSYSVDPPLRAAHRLAPGVQGVIVPEVEHAVKPIGPVRFLVEFWRRPA
jgi:tellurite methyltransferase